MGFAKIVVLRSLLAPWNIIPDDFRAFLMAKQEELENPYSQTFAGTVSRRCFRELDIKIQTWSGTSCQMKSAPMTELNMMRTYACLAHCSLECPQASEACPSAHT
jgi:hypothetical protein